MKDPARRKFEKLRKRFEAQMRARFGDGRWRLVDTMARNLGCDERERDKLELALMRIGHKNNAVQFQKESCRGHQVRFLAADPALKPPRPEAGDVLKTLAKLPHLPLAETLDQFWGTNLLTSITRSGKPGASVKRKR